MERHKAIRYALFIGSLVFVVMLGGRVLPCVYY